MSWLGCFRLRDMWALVQGWRVGLNSLGLTTTATGKALRVPLALGLAGVAGDAACQAAPALSAALPVGRALGDGGAN